MIDRESLMVALSELEREIYDLSKAAAGELCVTTVSADHVAALLRISGRQLRDLYRKLEENSPQRVTQAEVALWVEQAVRHVHRWFGAPGEWGYETYIGKRLQRIYS